MISRFYGTYCFNKIDYDLGKLLQTYRKDL